MNLYETTDAKGAHYYKLKYWRKVTLTTVQNDLRKRFEGNLVLTYVTGAAYPNEFILEYHITGYKENGKPVAYIRERQKEYATIGDKIDLYLPIQEAILFYTTFFNELKNRKIIEAKTT